MRRQDREVTDPQRIQAIIDACPVCRLGFYDEQGVYIVPLNFGYAYRDGRWTLYFHGAQEGRKRELLRRNPTVGFEMDAHFELLEGPNACQYSARYQSVIGTGRASVLEDPEVKKAALRTIMVHLAGEGPWTFSDAQVQAVCVFAVDVLQLSCKEH